MIIQGPLHTETITVRRITQGGPDPDGIPVEVLEEFTPPYKYNVQQIDASEDIVQRTQLETRYSVSGPPILGIVGTDQIEWRGNIYRIDGDPDTRDNTANIEHVHFTMYQQRG